jgi:hypothetical protein
MRGYGFIYTHRRTNQYCEKNSKQTIISTLSIMYIEFVACYDTMRQTI